MLEFQDLPPEVIEAIFSQCTSPSVLQLRLVSKSIKRIVDHSERFKNDLFEELWIHLDRGRHIRRFVVEAPDFPFQNLSITTAEPTTPPYLNLLKDHGLLRWFIKRFSPSIRKLRVSHMYCGTVVGEMEFYESLEKLQVLEINSLEPLGEGDSRGWGFQVCPRRLPISGPVGHSMKSLQVQKEKNSGDFFMEWIRLCPSLEVLKVPNKVPLAVFPYVLRLGAEGNLEHLKVLDLNGVKMNLFSCSDGDIRFFSDLLTRSNDFRLKNVSAAMLEKVRTECVPPKWSRQTLELFQAKVVSVSGVHVMLKEDGGFGVLEELTFTTWDRSLPFLGWKLNNGGQMGLPSLKRIEGWSPETWTPQFQDFLDSLFLPEEPRETVEELQFHFQWRVEGITMTPAYLDGAFPNLTRVVLNLGGFSRAEAVEVIEVLSRKTLLEDLSLETLRGIPVEAFFGNEVETPVLLRFTSLRKLSLQSKRRRCEVMGDRTLRLLARMSLTHLRIKDRGWETVTEEGVNALADGPFGKSVVSLELDGLKGRDKVKRWAALLELKGAAQRNKVKWRLNSDDGRIIVTLRP